MVSNYEDRLPVYLHGLEGDPDGTKGSFVKQVFGRSGPDMPAHRDPDGRTLDQVPSCFETCLEIARAYLEEASASVLVGSSFGGAVTVELLHRGLWRGPVVLLAPAAHVYGLNLKLPTGCHAIIIHDPHDDLIPYSGSEEMARVNPNQVELWSSDGGHGLHTTTQTGLLELAIRRQVERADG